jgi:hypothetical protein
MALSRIRLMIASLATCGLVAGVGALPASARTTTLRYFSKQVYFRISNRLGQRLPSNSKPAIGDRISFASIDYVGNHTHHAKKATASDHVDCTITSPSGGICDGQIAIGGSMILGEDFPFSLTSNTQKVIITGGTGRYGGASGTVSATSVSKNGTDLTIRVTT